MKCCKPEQDVAGKKTDQAHNCGGGIKHTLLMLGCCLAPLGLVLLLQQNGNTGAAGYLLLLLCPLMHLFMMRGMRHKENPASDRKETSESQ